MCDVDAVDLGDLYRACFFVQVKAFDRYSGLLRRSNLGGVTYFLTMFKKSIARELRATWLLSQLTDAT